MFEVTEGYRFEPVPVPAWDGWKEFGHITGVKILGSWSYHQNDITRIISRKFGSYRSPENRVKNEVMRDAVQELLLKYRVIPA